MQKHAQSNLPSLLFLLALALAGRSYGNDRIQMVGPSPTEEAVREIAETLEVACKNRDIKRFLSQFTPSRAAQLRRLMEDLFVCDDVELEIHDTLLLSANGSSIIFGIRYTWGNSVSPSQVIASRVTARKVGDLWMLDSEEILSRRNTLPAFSGTENAARGAARAGLPHLPPRPDCIPADIGWVPGGCANGRCGL